MKQLHSGPGKQPVRAIPAAYENRTRAFATARPMIELPQREWDFMRAFNKIESSNPKERAEALEFFKHLPGTRAARRHILNCLGDVNEEVRRKAVAVVKETWLSRKEIAMLEEFLLGTKNTERVGRMVQSLGEVGNPQTAETLIKLTHHAHEKHMLVLLPKLREAFENIKLTLVSANLIRPLITAAVEDDRMQTTNAKIARIVFGS